MVLPPVGSYRAKTITLYDFSLSSTEIPDFWNIFVLKISLYFYVMPNTLSSVDAIDAGGPAYSVTRKLVKAGAFSASPNLSTMPHRLNCVSILLILLVTVLDLLLQLSTLKYSWQTFQLILGSNETQNVKEYTFQLGGG